MLKHKTVLQKSQKRRVYNYIITLWLKYVNKQILYKYYVKSVNLNTRNRQTIEMKLCAKSFCYWFVTPENPSKR